MAHIRIEHTQTEVFYPTTQKRGLWQKYLAYTEKVGSKQLYWYMISLLLISCVAMPLAFCGMYVSGGNPLWFVALGMGLLVANILVNVAELHPRITVSFFFLSFTLLLLIPLIQIAFNGITI